MYLFHSVDQDEQEVLRLLFKLLCVIPKRGEQCADFAFVFAEFDVSSTYNISRF